MWFTLLKITVVYSQNILHTKKNMVLSKTVPWTVRWGECRFQEMCKQLRENCNKMLKTFGNCLVWLSFHPIFIRPNGRITGCPPSKWPSLWPKVYGRWTRAGRSRRHRKPPMRSWNRWMVWWTQHLTQCLNEVDEQELVKMSRTKEVKSRDDLNEEVHQCSISD